MSINFNQSGIDLEVRRKGICAFMKFSSMSFEKALELDRLMCETKQVKSRYLLELKRMLFNMANNPMLHKTSCDDLIVMTNEEMVRGTIVERVQNQERQRHEAFLDMLKERSGEIMSSQPESIIHCKKCGSSNLNFVQIQTRSADEPMTCIFSCQNKRCNSKWRMN